MKFSKIIFEAKRHKGYFEDEFCIEYYDKEGRTHREDGPAWISKTIDREEYWVHGVRHRTDGPAIIDNHHRIIMYYVNGKLFTKDEFEKHFGGDD